MQNIIKILGDHIVRQRYLHIIPKVKQIASGIIKVLEFELEGKLSKLQFIYSVQIQFKNKIVYFLATLWLQLVATAQSNTGFKLF